MLSREEEIKKVRDAIEYANLTPNSMNAKVRLAHLQYTSRELTEAEVKEKDTLFLKLRQGNVNLKSAREQLRILEEE